MQRVEIVTIVSQNYGNRLQNYALQEALSKMGFEVYTNRYRKKNLKEKMLAVLFALRGKKRHDLFYRFESMINWADTKYIDRDNPSVDFYIAGSDQIWNPEFEFNSDREFLCFVAQEKRIAYAGSIGVQQIPKNLKDKYAENFKMFKCISVREEQGKKIIHELTSRDVPVLVDPTLLIKQDEWKQLLSKSKIRKNFKHPYILKYFLGFVNDKHNEQIIKIAKKNGLNIIDLSPSSANVCAGPCEFLYCIANAQWVCTDSFHAVVFSAIFNKDFQCIERNTSNSTEIDGMYSRMETLKNKLKLNSGWIKCDEVLPADIVHIDYSHIEQRIEEERNLAYDFLKNSLM